MEAIDYQNGPIRGTAFPRWCGRACLQVRVMVWDNAYLVSDENDDQDLKEIVFNAWH